jgi:hypothetical protein
VHFPAVAQSLERNPIQSCRVKSRGVVYDVVA